MSIYYQCRFNKVTLDLKDRQDIVTWIKDCEHEKRNLKLNSILERDIRVPKDIMSGSRCVQLFYNSFDDEKNDEFTVIYSENNILTLDFCLGNKNKNNDIEEVIVLFSKYWLSGDIILDNERCYLKFDMEVNKNNTELSIDNLESKMFCYEDVEDEIIQASEIYELFWEDYLQPNDSFEVFFNNNKDQFIPLPKQWNPVQNRTLLYDGDIANRITAHAKESMKCCVICSDGEDVTTAQNDRQELVVAHTPEYNTPHYTIINDVPVFDCTTLNPDDFPIAETIVLDSIGSFTGNATTKKKPKYGLKRRLKATKSNNSKGLTDVKQLVPYQDNTLIELMNKGVSMLEISEAVREIEEKFGVKAGNKHT